MAYEEQKKVMNDTVINRQIQAEAAEKYANKVQKLSNGTKIHALEHKRTIYSVDTSVMVDSSPKMTPDRTPELVVELGPLAADPYGKPNPSGTRKVIITRKGEGQKTVEPEDLDDCLVDCLGYDRDLVASILAVFEETIGEPGFFENNGEEDLSIGEVEYPDEAAPLPLDVQEALDALDEPIIAKSSQATPIEDEVNDE